MHGKKMIRKCSNQIISCICIEVAKDAEFKFGNIKKKKKTFDIIYKVMLFKNYMILFL